MVPAHLLYLQEGLPFSRLRQLPHHHDQGYLEESQLRRGAVLVHGRPLPGPGGVGAHWLRRTRAAEAEEQEGVAHPFAGARRARLPQRWRATHAQPWHLRLVRHMPPSPRKGGLDELQQGNHCQGLWPDQAPPADSAEDHWRCLRHLRDRAGHAPLPQGLLSPCRAQAAPRGCARPGAPQPRQGFTLERHQGSQAQRAVREQLQGGPQAEDAA
mmetsp:Transcript_4563/g.16054  ORF Transcript_4563/g.16054 Transcript_4563/m.16054 type:complete len:213 (-) Transcript_4563:1254-1892(-)